MNLERSFRQSPATNTIVLAIVAVYLLTAFQSHSLLNNLSASSLGDSWMLYAPAMTHGWGPLRAVGATFLHIGPGHMLLNLMLLWLLGRELEKYLGAGLFAMVYLVGGIGASAAVVWMDPLSPTAGASGAIYALMAILVGLFARRGADLRAPLTLIAVNLGYTFLADNVSLWGHVGGLITGAILAWPLMKATQERTRWFIAIASLIGAVIVLFLGIPYP
ncbi:rhomboid family intramembrane serine protease [Corynebacterium callunae]|uniref:rhomboid family intramembrane serine protease n=1 Tax=Corynebacterium callunae TaxID=1721 RepID=UPI0039826D4C